jgi:GNAT superfamily N-acetyltransferase
VIGPINPVSQYWGCLFEGFGAPPTYMTAHNPPHYNAFFMRSGYAKVKDLVAYEADVARGYAIPDRFRRFARKLTERRAGLSVRRIDMRQLEREAEAIWRITNASLEGNWGYYPVSRDIMRDMLKRLRLIVDPDAIWFVEHNGEPVGYALAHRDINVALAMTGGRLFPFGFVRLLREIPRISRYRLIALGVLPQYHNRGLDVLLYVSLHDALAPRGNILLDANWILEDNAVMRNAVEKLGLVKTKTYRIYHKTLADS